MIKFANARSRWSASAALIHNVQWLIAERVLRLLLGVAVGAWVARYLGPAAFGTLAYWVALFSILQILCSLGLESIVVRDVARNPSAGNAVLSTTVTLRVTCGVACWLAALAGSALGLGGNRAEWIIVALLGATLWLQPADVVDLWLQTRMRNKESVLPKSLAYVAAAGVKVALIESNAPLWTFAAALLLESALTALALGWILRRAAGELSLSWSLSGSAGLLREAWPLLLSGLSIAVYMRIDMVMLRTLAGERELGLYSAILPVSQAWHMIPMTICASVMPKFSVLRLADPALYERRLLQLFSAMAWAGISAATMTALLAPWIVRTLLGDGFIDSIAVLRWHVFTNVFVCLGVAQSVAIVNDGRTRLALVRTLIGAVVSLLLNSCLIPTFGAMGAAWSAIAAYATSAVFSNAILAPKYFRMQVKSLLFIHVAARD